MNPMQVHIHRVTSSVSYGGTCTKIIRFTTHVNLLGKTYEHMVLAKAYSTFPYINQKLMMMMMMP
jgi:hypothetical protein